MSASSPSIYSPVYSPDNYSYNNSNPNTNFPCGYGYASYGTSNNQNTIQYDCDSFPSDYIPSNTFYNPNSNSPYIPNYNCTEMIRVKKEPGVEESCSIIITNNTASNSSPLDEEKRYQVINSSPLIPVPNNISSADRSQSVSATPSQQLNTQLSTLMSRLTGSTPVVLRNQQAIMQNTPLAINSPFLSVPATFRSQSDVAGSLQRNNNYNNNTNSPMLPPARSPHTFDLENFENISGGGSMLDDQQQTTQQIQPVTLIQQQSGSSSSSSTVSVDFSTQCIHGLTSNYQREQVISFENYLLDSLGDDFIADLQNYDFSFDDCPYDNPDCHQINNNNTINNNNEESLLPSTAIDSNSSVSDLEMKESPSPAPAAFEQTSNSATNGSVIRSRKHTKNARIANRKKAYPSSTSDASSNSPSATDCPHLSDSYTDNNPEIINYTDPDTHTQYSIRLPRALNLQFARAADLCDPLQIAPGNNGREFKKLPSQQKCWFKVISDSRHSKGEAGINITELGLEHWMSKWTNRRMRTVGVSSYAKWLKTVLIPKLRAVNQGRNVPLNPMANA